MTLKEPGCRADQATMATASDGQTIQAQIEAIEDCVRVERTLFLLYGAERDRGIPAPLALDHAVRMALEPEARDRVRDLADGKMDTESFDGRCVMSNFMGHAEAFWREHRQAV